LFSSNFKNSKKVLISFFNSLIFPINTHNNHSFFSGDASIQDPIVGANAAESLSGSCPNFISRLLSHSSGGNTKSTSAAFSFDFLSSLTVTEDDKFNKYCTFYSGRSGVLRRYWAEHPDYKNKK
jgi:hypothetical protein